MNLSHYIDHVRYLTGEETDSILAATASEDSAEVEETISMTVHSSSVHRGEPPEVGGAEALAVQAFIEAAYRSSELGQLVRPTDVLAGAGV